MSIQIGNTITTPNTTTRERVSLSSITESNLILMKSTFSDVNIALFSDNDNNNFTIGKSGNKIKITQNNSLVATLSLACNIFYSPTYLNNFVSIGQSINIGTTLTASKLDTSNIKITPPLISNIAYLLASNTNGTLLSANTNGFVNIIGNVNIGALSSNPNYSLMVDKNVSIASNLDIRSINATTTISAPTINNNRINGRSSGGAPTYAYIDFGQSGSSSGTQPSLTFNQSTPVWGGAIQPSTAIQGNLTVNGTVFATQVQSLNQATSFSILNVTSNINTASAIITNIPTLKQPTFSINHSNYNNYDILDINLYTTTSNINTGSSVLNRVHALTIDANGLVKIGGISKNYSLLSVESTINNNNITSNLVSIIGYNNSNSVFYINNTADVGIGTTDPINRLHITQSIGETSSNNPLIGLYATTLNSSNYNTGSNTTVISDLLVGYSNNITVLYIKASGDIATNGNIIANSYTASNYINTNTLNTSILNTSSIRATNTSNTSNIINYNNSSVSNINIVSALTGQYSNINARNINTVNFFIPNLSIFNDMGYYAVYTQQLWFTGSNIVMSSYESDRIANTAYGKLVVRTDDQVIIPNTISQNAIGLNAIGAKQSSIRVTSGVQPNVELFGPNTTTYIGATNTANLSGDGANMLYISHLLNDATTNSNVYDKPYRAQIKMYATNNNGISGGTTIENVLSINTGTISNKGNVGIGITNPTSTFQVIGTCLIQQPNSLNPILFATSTPSYNNIPGGSIQLGVGTTNPLYQLDVVGTLYARNSGSFNGNIYTDGSVGIGITTPATNLHVVGNGYVTNTLSVGANPAGIGANTLLVGGVGANILRNLYVGSNIGIGTTQPQYNLDVNGTANFSSNVIMKSLTITDTIIGSVSGSSSIVTNPVQPNITLLSAPSVTITNLSATNPINGSVTGSSSNVTFPIQYNITSLPNITSIGNVGENTTFNCIGTFSSNLTVQGRLTTYGNFGSVSDSNIKINLEQINSPLDKIGKLTGYTYKRIDSREEKRETGLLAQDVINVLPEVVNKNEDLDDLLTISYGNMAGLWVEAFKEMRAEINSLKARIATLEQR